MQPGAPRRLRADAARNRARIIQTAETLFASDGLAVGLNTIAARAGVGAGTLHRQFPSKASLVAAIVARALRQRIDAAEHAHGCGEEPGQVLRKLITELLDDGQANRGLKDMLAAEHTTIRAYDPGTADAFATTLDTLIAAAQHNGTISPGLHPDDIGAILAAGLAAQAHLGARPERIGAIRSHLLTALDP